MTSHEGELCSIIRRDETTAAWSWCCTGRPKMIERMFHQLSPSYELLEGTDSTEAAAECAQRNAALLTEAAGSGTTG